MNNLLFSANLALRQVRLLGGGIVLTLVVSISQVVAAPSALARSEGCDLVKNTAARHFCLAGKSEFYKGNYGLAQTLLKQALASSPREGVIRVQLARVFIQFNDTALAERELQRAQRDGAPPLETLPVLFYVMIQNGKETSILTKFSEPPPVAVGPLAAEILKGRAMAFEALGLRDEAVASIDRSLSLHPTVSSLLFRATLAGKMGDAALSNKMVDQAYSLARDDVTAMSRKLRQLEAKNDIRGAMSLADRMIKLYPVNSDPWEVKIRVLMKQKEDAKAAALVESYLGRRPGSYFGQFYKAVLLSRAKKKKEAGYVVQLIPTNFVQRHPQYALTMSDISRESHHDDSQILMAGIAGDPDNIDLRLRYAELIAAQDNLHPVQSAYAAIQILTRAESTNDPRVKKLLAQLRARVR